MKKPFTTIKFKESDTLLIIHNGIVYYPKNFGTSWLGKKKPKKVLVEFERIK